MGQTIGAAGRYYGKGRVAALTKAVNLENLNVSNEEFFIRMLKNIILWVKSDMYTNNSQGSQYAPRNSVAFFRNDNTEFDARIQQILTSMTHGASKLDPWYEVAPFTGSLSSNKYGVIIIIPSYSALDGTRMRDDTQRHILNDVYNFGTGLVIAEWFHLLNSLPNKRSFTYEDPDNVPTIAGLENDGRVAGLIDASPFIPEDNVVFSDADSITYSVNDVNDDTSFAISPVYQLNNFALDTPFDGHISQLGQVKNDAIIFWDTDLPAEVTTTTTTTTTTTSIPYDEIKLKVGEFFLENVCGPQKLYLSGQDKDFFLMEGREIFLTKNIEEPVELNFDIVAEDYFENKRFNKVVEHMTIKLIECDKPITLPKNGSKPQYSYRNPQNGTYNAVWGDNAPSEIISPYEEYSFTGQGLIEKPAIVCLGGKHNDDNVFWMQLNEGGEYTVEFNKDLAITDCVAMFLVENTPESNLHPTQHDLKFDQWRQDQTITDGATVTRLFDAGAGSNFNSGRYCGQGVNTFSFNVDQPMAVDPENQNVLLTGEAYLIFNLQKNLYVSDHSDTGCATITYGTTTTAPPPEYDFVVFIQNDAFDVQVTDTSNDPVTAFKFTSVASNAPGVDRVELRITPTQPNTVFDNLLVQESSDYITIGNGSESSTVKIIYVYLQEMPTNGGQATVVITGASVTTTTTEPPPPPPKYPVRVTITDDLGLVYLNTYTNNYEFTQGINYAYFNWYVNAGFEYRPSTAATQNPYQYYDRPTITQIISQNPPGMVSLPSPTPASGGANKISVGRGIPPFWGQENTRGQIAIPISVPVLGGEIELRLSGAEPVPTTTTTTTTTLPPCDDTIYIICRQVLNCGKNADGECVPQAGSYQEVVFSTCCPLSDAEVLDIVKSHNGAATTDLNTIYAAQCPANNFELLAPCFAEDSNGRCQETIHSEIIDTINCGASQNPLP